MAMEKTGTRLLYFSLVLSFLAVIPVSWMGAPARDRTSPWAPDSHP